MGKGKPAHERNRRQAREWDIARARQRDRVVLWRGSREQSTLRQKGIRHDNEKQESED